MAIKTYFNRLRGWTKSSARAAKARKATSRLGVETLEERLALSTVSIANRVLTYQASVGEVNSLQISRAGNTFTFAETGGVAIQQGNGFFPSVTADGSLFDRIQVNLGDRDDRLTVLSTNKRIDALGESGNDTFTVGAAGRGMEDVLAPVNVNGGTQTIFFGRDQLFLADRDAPPGSGIFPSRLSYAVNGASLTRQRRSLLGPVLSQVQVTSTGMEGVVLNASNQADLISVASTAAFVPVEINAGGGDDAISTGNMDLLAGRLTVRGEAGADTLTITDTAAATNRNYVIKTDAVSQGTSTVNLATLEGLTIKGPNKINNFEVQSASDAMPLKLVGGTLADLIQVSDSALTAGQTYSFGAGKLERFTQAGFFTFRTELINHSGVDNLVVNAGRGGDTFQMTDTAQPALFVNGGDGVDTIDYSAFTTDVVVNLFTGRATKVTALTGIDNATGGAGNDVLVGNALANVLLGKGGRDVLIGGRGADTLFSGAGEDLMIAGDTAFDGDAIRLNTIRNVWAGPGTAVERSNRLKAGVGFLFSFVKFDDSTIHVTGALDDGARDVLQPHDEGLPEEATTPDWFWANPGNFATQDQISLLAGDIFK